MGMINSKVRMATVSWGEVEYEAGEGERRAFGGIGNIFFLKLEIGSMEVC